jgi:hypothetical protein
LCHMCHICIVSMNWFELLSGYRTISKVPINLLFSVDEILFAYILGIGKFAVFDGSE